ncbi:uncharacterized protein LOC117170256 isoform X2 [Belonocnema kinseyi]|uniref:uncharacterized protein LOC117170256 isoform X2 n=1 Tax=Belonocnema kinseyi TaxID=2817044 RepID=UPI00143D0BD1|nr:uncharacterized protein LOC117170256 isoform X2 [Belonocnema kinseyi]
MEKYSSSQLTQCRRRLPGNLNLTYQTGPEKNPNQTIRITKDTEVLDVLLGGRRNHIVAVIDEYNYVRAIILNGIITKLVCLTKPSPFLAKERNAISLRFNEKWPYVNTNLALYNF